MTPPLVPAISAVLMTESQTGLVESGLSATDSVEIIAISRTLEEFQETVARVRPQVVIIDTDQPYEAGFQAIPIAFAAAPSTAVLVRIPVSAPHNHVARAMKAGALGFVTSDAGGEELGLAAKALSIGQPWLPAEQSRALFSSVGEAGELTAAGREAKLRSFVLGLIPLTGGVSAVMSLLWRRYLGQIGVRPVDIAIDPTTRIVDALFALSALVAIFGTLLFVPTWVDLLQTSTRPRLRDWTSRHRRATTLILGYVVLTIGAILASFALIVVSLFIGPIVGGLLGARAFDLDDNLPAALRPRAFRTKRTGQAALLIVLAFLTVLSAEVLVTGPSLQPDGAHGLFAPTVLGFKAQPMRHITVDGSREPREVLYLGGNADLYVLVDPCNGDEVEFDSVGSSQLIVIDVVTCP